MVGTMRDAVRAGVTLVGDFLSEMPGAVSQEGKANAYAAGWAAVRNLPQPVAEEVFRRGADIATWRQGKGVRRLRSNLSRVLGPEASEAKVNAVTKEGMRSYSRYWMEVFRPQTYDPQQIKRDTELDGWPLFEELQQLDKPFIFSLSHSGNWEAAGVWLIATGYPFTTVAERLEPESLFQQFVDFREGLGMEVLPLTGGAAPPFGILADRLRSGRSVCLLGDRDLSRHGVEVEFFGATAKMPAGPALLAIDTGAILLPPCLFFTPGGWGLGIDHRVEVPDEGSRREKVQVITQEVATLFEGFIRRFPQDWHMLQRIWLDDLDPARVAEEKARAAEQEQAASDPASPESKRDREVVEGVAAEAADELGEA